jgi:glycerol-3-phosphate acyltransferase PlsX
MIKEGYDAPQIVLEAVEKAVNDFKDLEIILFGDKDQCNLNHGRVEVRHCTEEITMEDEPVRLMSAGLFIVGRISGVSRPALVVTLPTTSGRGFVFMDVGANADAKAEHLLQYAQLGNIYAQKIRGIEQPSVGLLNIGTEAAKGNALTKKAFNLMEEQNDFKFNGNVEAKGLMEDAADVIVTDGYTGNMILKNLEGVAKAFGKMFKETLLSSFKNKMAALVLRKDLQGLTRKMDYAEYGGSVLLGLDGIVVKAHGSSSAKAFYSAIRQAKIAGEQEIVKTMRETVGE